MENLLVFIATRYIYIMTIILMMIGLYALIAKKNLVKKVIGLNIFQTAIFLFYISFSDVDGGTAPIYLPDGVSATYVNPLPHVLILTAIVVGLAITAVALAIVVGIYEEYQVTDEDGLQEVMKRQ